MPNVIKYSTTIQPNTIKKGNVLLGVNNLGYGPSNVTGYWAGINPPTSGYTIYRVAPETSGYTINTCETDNDVIYWANVYGNTGGDNINQALLYLTTGSSNTAIVNKNYESIVTSGLTYLFDGGFTPSYPKTGNIWYDLSGNQFNGSLINGPTFSATSIVFDGIDDYMTLPIGITLTGATTMLYVINGNYQNYYLSIFERSSVKGAGLSTPIPSNGWMQLGYIWDGTSNKFIINGTVYSANTGGAFPYDYPGFKPLFWGGAFNYFGSNSSPNLSFHLQNTVGGYTGFLWSAFTYQAINITATAGNRKYFSGATSNILIYNRALSSSEISQNYEATMKGYVSFDIQYLVVAGGGGGNNNRSGGGGAGGLLSGITSSISLNTNYTVTVGAGGSFSTNGSDSTFSTTVSIGGGRSGVLNGDGFSGGSGGGSGHFWTGIVAQSRIGGSGVSGQGFSGGTAFSGTAELGPGGGGASQSGGNSNSVPFGFGGSGLYFSEYVTLGGSPAGWFAGGGGGGNSYGSTKALGGNGGGGNGSIVGLASTNGVINTGGGGGGNGVRGGGAASGGSGVIILRIPVVFSANFSSGVSYTLTKIGGYSYYRITATSTTSETVTFS